MNTDAAIRARPRRLRDILADIHESQYVIQALRSLMGEAASLDTRPLLITEGAAERIGPDPVPADLRMQYATECARYGALQLEFIEAKR